MCNLLVINAEKSTYIIFESGRCIDENLVTSFTLQIGDRVITRENSAKYLGLIIDSKLDWSVHIEKVRSKLASISFMMRRVKNYVQPDVLWKIYFAHFQSHLMNLNCIWSAASQSRIKAIHVIQNRTIKMMKSLPYLTTSKLLYDEKILPFEVLTNHSIVMLIFKVKYGLIKNDFNLTVVNQAHSYNTSNIVNFVVNFIRTSKSRTSIKHRGLTLFNNLPQIIKDETSLSKFSKLSKQFYFNLYKNSP